MNTILLSILIFFIGYSLALFFANQKKQEIQKKFAALFCAALLLLIYLKK